MTKEDFEKSLLISNKTAYMDPRVDYRKWLRNTLHAVLDDAIAGDEGSKNFLKTAISTLVLWQSDERIKINFDTWIWPYVDLVEEAKKQSECRHGSVFCRGLAGVLPITLYLSHTGSLACGGLCQKNIFFS